MYDVRNLSKSILSFPAHEGRNIRHLSFQKHLAGEENSTVDIPEINSFLNNQPRVECNNQSVGSFSIAVDEDSISVGNVSKNDKKETQDSFLAALGSNDSPTTEVNRESGRTGVEKGINISKCIELPQLLQLKRSLQTSFPLNITQSISKYLQDDLHSTEICPVVGSTERTRKIRT
ncbi:hypothetical protein ILUMI_12841 [Ignelater luminosus]|uniref:Uncharacterized protein n=1 Tax=Ignelater luminosus TaxID=2038154 RepID=A0A8K0CXD3_IGNLU|nr:hypothetical protein ILUMI_12841 [Ignelater luminosus]